MEIIVGLNPVYHESPVPDLAGNPLAEVIFPPWTSEDEIAKRLSRYPNFKETERSFPSRYRAFFAGRLRNFNLANDLQVTFAGLLRDQIARGYQFRNPMNRDGQYYLYDAKDATYSLNQLNHGNSPSQISLFVGPPGIGKTSTLCASVNVLGPTVIVHQEYNGKPFSESQVLYLGIDLPSTVTRKAVVVALRLRLNEIMDRVPEWDAKPAIGERRQDYMSSLRQAVANYHVGTILIDGAENISIGGPKGVADLDALLRELRDDLNVSAVVIGTHSLEDAIFDDQSVAQRFCDGFYLRASHYKSEQDKDFKALTDFLGFYQWTKNPVDISSLRAVLYECSQGITRVLLDLYILAQFMAINSGGEVITQDLVLRVYREHFKPIHPAMCALRTGDELALRKFEGFFPRAYKELERTGILSQVIAAMQSKLMRESRADNKNSPSQNPRSSKAQALVNGPWEDIRPVGQFPLP